MNKIFCQIKDTKIIPVLKLEKEELAIPLINTITAVGLSCPEITFRTACASSCIKKIKEFNKDITVGAGTINSIEDAKKALDAGADFLVSPGSFEPLLDWCSKNSITFIPGVTTPTEIQKALNYGFNILKFFPAEACGGTKMLEALTAPFGQISFIPTGGINQENANDYLSLKCVFALGGSWMVPTNLINQKDWNSIRELCKKTVYAISTQKKGNNEKQ